MTTAEKIAAAKKRVAELELYKIMDKEEKNLKMRETKKKNNLDV